MKKRFASLLLTIALLFSLISVPVNAVSASAQENTEITVQIGSITAKAGDSNVAVEIFLKNNPGISGFSFCVDYDVDNFVFVKSEVNISDGYPVATPINDHQINIAWAGSGTYNANEIIATLYFNVPKTATVGKHDIKISYRDGYDSFYQYVGGTEQDISATAINGYVQIEEAVTTSKLTVSAGAVTASMNDIDVIVPVVVSNNTGLSGFSFCVNYDESRLEYKSAEIKIDGGYKVINHPEEYAVCLAWTDENQYVQNTSIAELHFAVKTNAKPGKAYVNILFRDSYDSFYKTINKQEVDIECIAESGYVNIMNHNFGEWQIVKAATCTETGLKRRSCTDAGCLVVDELVIPIVAHNYVDTITEATCSSEGYTTHRCSGCGASYIDAYVKKKVHTVGEWEITNQPGCTTPGIKVKKCSVCKEIVETEEIRATGHDYGEWETFKSATFSEDGESRKQCQNCDYFQSKRIPKLSENHTHSFTGREEIIKDATCIEGGSKKVFCYESECGKYITVNIAPTGHTADKWETTVSPGCLTSGIKVKKCIICREIIETQVIPATGHSWDSGIITTEPTTTTEGVKTFTCEVCHETRSEAMPMLEEIPEDAAKLVMDNAVGIIGETFTVDVKLVNNPGFIGMNFYIECSDGLTLVNVENKVQALQVTSDRTVVFDAGADYAQDGTLVTLTFSVSEDADVGTGWINIVMLEAFNASNEDVTIYTVRASVQITDCIFGDANGDGVVNTRDIVLIRQYVAAKDPYTGISTVSVYAGADANGDGQVNTRDVVLVRQYVAAKDPITGESGVVLGPNS